MPTKTETANVVTKIFGYDENADLRSSAIPWIFDEWFHGDFTTNRPDDLATALGTKSLEEYTQSFPDYRINSVVEIMFDTDGQTITNPNATITDPADSNSPGGLAPVTLEGAEDEPTNPLRTTYDYDGSQNYLDATVKGPHTAHQRVGPIGSDGIEGYRASVILGGSDPYLAKLKKDIESLAALTGSDVPAAISRYAAHVTTFYSFLDFVFMADGAKLVRVWDASVYPAHALYVGGIKRRQNQFQEGEEWVKQGPIGAHKAFFAFGVEGNTMGATPFDQYGSWGYKTFFDESGSGPHPVMDYGENGTQIRADTVRNQLSTPLFPNSLSPI